VRLRFVDTAQYQARLINYDYDMIQNTWVSSLSPGNEQLFRWSTVAARTPGTYNFAGVENPAADAMIKALLAAKTEDEFVSAVRALDRVLLSGDYVIPLFYVPKQWVAYWTRFKHPDTTPLFGYNVDSWWATDAK
jgi:peptide/nickel transport system substrate-binding protein